MAAGNVDSRNLSHVGNLRLVTGRIDVDTTERAFAIADSKSSIVSAVVTAADNSGTSVAVTVVPNSSDGTEDNLNGSIWVGCAADVKAYYQVLLR